MRLQGRLLISALALWALVGAAWAGEQPSPSPGPAPAIVPAPAPGPSTTPTPPPQVSVFDRLKKVEAGGVVFQFSAEERLRAEKWNNEDLDNDKKDRDVRWFSRLRLRTEASVGDWFKGVVEVVDGREEESERHPRPQNDELDLHQAYVQLGNKPLSVRLGRQEIDLGSRRVVAAPTWNNLLRSFDAARVMYTSDVVDVSAFCGSVVVPVDDEFNRHRRDERFSGIFTTLKPVKDHKIDLYAFRLHTWNDDYYVTSEDKVKGPVRLYTYGARTYGNITKRWTYDVEAVMQRGHYSNDEVRAYAFHADTAYTLDLPWEPTIQPVFNWASGDKNPTDGRRNTFTPLYPSTHNMFGGITDVVTWSNAEVVGLRFRVKPVKKLLIGFEAHRYWLVEDTDSWYTTSMKSRRRDKTGKSGDDLGCEVGMWARYTVSKQCDIEGGAARFFPGQFVEKTGPSDTECFCYFQTTLRF